MGIGLFPQKRKVLTEKAVSIGTANEGVFRIDFHYQNQIETFIVRDVSMPIMQMNDTYVGRFQEWGTGKFTIEECEGPGNGEHMSKWINSNLFKEHRTSYVHSRAWNISFKRLYDDQRTEISTDIWMLYGCLPVSVSDDEGRITIEIQPNYCELRSIEH